MFPHKKRRLSKATTTTTTTTTKHEISLNVIACEYSRLSLPREVSVIRAEKFHTDDVNLSRIASDGMMDSVNRQLTFEGFKHCTSMFEPRDVSVKIRKPEHSITQLYYILSLVVNS